MTDTTLAEMWKAYKKHYNRGWRSSGGAYASLDRGDANNEPDAWYDGYLDLAAGGPKWHSLNRKNVLEEMRLGRYDSMRGIVVMSFEEAEKLAKEVQA